MAFKVSEPNTKLTNLIKIESFLNDQSYSDLIEYSANFNARLCIERRLRMPFLDPQTGVAQKHSNLYMKKTQRIPGLQEGQIYTYPSPRWRCKRNSASFNSRPFYRFRSSVVATNHNLLAAVPNPMVIPPSAIINTESDANDFQALIDAESNSAADTDSKDSQVVKDETMSKEWFYDEMEANDVNSEQGDSDFDYNVNGYKRKKKPPTTRKTPSRKPKDTRSSSSSNRNSRSKKPSRSSKSKGDQGGFMDAEPRGFADIDNVQGDLFDGVYRSF
jgi:zinc finger protein ubi-d4